MFMEPYLRERLINLETKITYQDDIIDELNKVVTQQQNQLDKLLNKMENMSRMMTSVSESQIRDISQEVPPPHY